MKLSSEQEMIDYGRQLAKTLRAPTVVELIGDVGAGKTTITKGIAEGLGVQATVTSPSFTVSQHYAARNGVKLVHYDFYRLDDPGLMADDLAEHLQDPQTITVIEWGQSVANLLPPHHTVITISYQDDGSRVVTKEQK